MVTISIYGANGYVGDAIRTEALRRGHNVLAFSRSTTVRENSVHATTLRGDLHDAVSVREAAKKSDVIVVAIPARELDGKKLVDSVPVLLECSSETGTRIGFVGGAGSLRISTDGPLLMETEGFPAAALPEASNQGKVLETLRQARTGSWFYVSPAAAFGAHAPQNRADAYVVGGDVMERDSRGQSAISALDYANAFLDEIETPQHLNTRFSVIGAY